jgi:hypothetical protein
VDATAPWKEVVVIEVSSRVWYSAARNCPRGPVEAIE